MKPKCADCGYTARARRALGAPVRSAKDYVAGEVGYLYPAAGADLPPDGAKVLLLTSGGIPVTGIWPSDARYMVWSPMPCESSYRTPATDGSGLPRSQSLLLLSKGGVCIFGPWCGDGRYLGWAPLPTRDIAKESAIEASRGTGLGVARFHREAA